MPIAYGGDNITFADGSKTTSAYTGFKNRIINGAMVIDQRNAGASVAVSNGTNTFITDRWSAFENSSGAFSWQQVTDAPSGFINSLKGTVTTADPSPSVGSIVQIKTTVEGLNVTDFAFGTASAKTFTLSFWVKSSLTGQFGGSFMNDSINRNYPFIYTISSANTWEYKTITVAGDTTGTWTTNNSVGIYVIFDMGSGSTYLGTANAWSNGDTRGAIGDTKLISTLNATWQITGVQLEVGSSASTFDYRPYGTELALCQRYYWQSQATAANWNNLGSGFNFSTTNSMVFVNYPVQMRSAPSVSTFGTINTTNVQILVQGGTTGASAVAGVGASETNALTTRVDFTSAGVTAGNGCIVRFAQNTGVTFSSEL